MCLFASVVEFSSLVTGEVMVHATYAMLLTAVAGHRTSIGQLSSHQYLGTSVTCQGFITFVGQQNAKSDPVGNAADAAHF